MTILTSQDGSRTLKMDSIDGFMISPSICLYALLENGGEYWVGKFGSEKRAKEVIGEIWYAIDAGISYTVPQEVNDDRTES